MLYRINSMWDIMYSEFNSKLEREVFIKIYSVKQDAVLHTRLHSVSSITRLLTTDLKKLKIK